METINVSDLPEPITQAIEAMVNTLLQQFQAQKRNRQSVKLPVWEGKPLGKLTREEMYDDVASAFFPGYLCIH